MLYIEGIPTFKIFPNGEKEPIDPDGWTIYWNNKEFVDRWLEKQDGSTMYWSDEKYDEWLKKYREEWLEKNKI